MSNREYLEVPERSHGEPGRYDVQILQRDYAVARATSGRHTAGVFLKPSGEPVGVLDWIEENPSDGKPWVGLVMIRADRRRRGLASEALDGLADRLRASGARSVRAGVLARNPAGRALLQRLGFESVSTTTVRMTSEQEVIVLERDL